SGMFECSHATHTCVNLASTLPARLCAGALACYATETRPSTISSQPSTFLPQHGLMEFVPVVKIIQVHRIFRGRGVIGDAACAQNTLARIVIVIVTAHGSVVLLDCVSRQ